MDALGSDDEGVLASMQMCSDKWLGPDEPQEQPLSTPRVDMEFVDLGEVSRPASHFRELWYGPCSASGKGHKTESVI